MPNKNNAIRLHELLTVIFQTTNEADSTKAAKSVFTKVVCGSEGNGEMFGRCLLDVYASIDDVKQQIVKMGGKNQAMYFDVAVWLDGLFSAVISGEQFSKVRANFNPNHQNGKLLLALGDLIEQFEMEVEATEEDISKTLEQIAALRKTIEQSALDKVSRHAILEYLTTLESGLRAYKIRGAEGLKDALTKAHGQIWMNQDSFSKAKEVIKDFVLYGKVFEHIYGIYKFCAPMAPTLTAGTVTDKFLN